MLAVLAPGIGPGVGALTDEVLGLGDDPFHPGILGGDGSVRVLAHDGVALLGAEHVHGFGAVGSDVEFSTGGCDRFPRVEPVPGRHVDLVGEFTGERNPADPGTHAGGERRFTEGHERERFGFQSPVGGQLRRHLGKDRAGFGPDDGNRAPLFGHRSAVHIQLRPLGLQPFLQPIQHLRGAAGGGGHEVGLLVQAQRHAVVEDHAVRQAHDTVTGRARGELFERVGVDPVQELTGVLAPDLDLAQGRGVHEAHRLTDGRALTQHGRVHVLPVLRVVPGPLPLPHVLEQGALRDVPGVNGRLAGGVEQLPALASGQCRERHGSERCAVGGGADVADATGGLTGGTQRGRDDADCVDTGSLALVIGGADGGVTLDVLHRAHTGSGRAQHVSN